MQAFTSNWLLSGVWGPQTSDDVEPGARGCSPAGSFTITEGWGEGQMLTRRGIRSQAPSACVLWIPRRKGAAGPFLLQNRPRVPCNVPRGFSTVSLCHRPPRPVTPYTVSGSRTLIRTTCMSRTSCWLLGRAVGTQAAVVLSLGEADADSVIQAHGHRPSGIRPEVPSAHHSRPGSFQVGRKGQGELLGGSDV